MVREPGKQLTVWQEDGDGEPHELGWDSVISIARASEHWWGLVSVRWVHKKLGSVGDLLRRIGLLAEKYLLLKSFRIYEHQGLCTCSFPKSQSWCRWTLHSSSCIGSNMMYSDQRLRLVVPTLSSHSQFRNETFYFAGFCDPWRLDDNLPQAFHISYSIPSSFSSCMYFILKISRYYNLLNAAVCCFVCRHINESSCFFMIRDGFID